VGVVGLTTASLPARLTRLGNSTFSECSGWRQTHIVRSGFNKDGDLAFSGCSGLKVISFAAGLTERDRSETRQYPCVPFSILAMLRTRQMPMPALSPMLIVRYNFCPGPQPSGTCPSSSALPNWGLYCTVCIVGVPRDQLWARPKAVGGEETTRYPACPHAHPVTFPHRLLSTSMNVSLIIQ
jgi:hypothetical protein